MKVLKFTEFENLVAHGNVIPVYATYFADLLTPVSAFLKLQKIADKAFLLESVEGGEKTARYSFLGCNPFCTIRYSENRIELEKAGNRTLFEGDIYDYLKHLLQKYQTVHPPVLPRFTRCAVGSLGYETV
ncbi:anthranilate synthase component I, partial [candidate division KSB1 bacterium]|nr:anthranilate synthase component I [candidate division KSB1 bacterium]